MLATHRKLFRPSAFFLPSAPFREPKLPSPRIADDYLRLSRLKLYVKLRVTSSTRSHHVTYIAYARDAAAVLAPTQVCGAAATTPSTQMSVVMLHSHVRNKDARTAGHVTAVRAESAGVDKGVELEHVPANAQLQERPLLCCCLSTDSSSEKSIGACRLVNVCCTLSSRHGVPGPIARCHTRWNRTTSFVERLLATLVSSACRE